LAHVKGSFVDERLRKSASDVLFSVRLAGREALVYLLFEHKSWVDPLVSYQLLRYMVRIWERYRRDHHGATTLPPIVPLVVHHSETGWTRSTSLHAVFGSVLEDIPELRRLVPNFEFLLDDVSHSSDADLRARSLDAFGALVLWALRDARAPGRLIGSVAGWQAELRQLARSPGGEEALKLLLRYIVVVSEESSADRFAEAVRAGAPEAEGILMTIAEQWREEGRQQGLAMAEKLREESRQQVLTMAEKLREEGRQQVLTMAEKLREEGISRARRQLVVKLLGLQFGTLDSATLERVERGTEEELDLWAERVLTATSLAEVFGG
jgi:hypothetical protein